MEAVRQELCPYSLQVSEIVSHRKLPSCQMCKTDVLRQPIRQISQQFFCHLLLEFPVRLLQFSRDHGSFGAFSQCSSFLPDHSVEGKALSHLFQQLPPFGLS